MLAEIYFSDKAYENKNNDRSLCTGGRLETILHIQKKDFVVGGETRKFPSRTITRHMKSILDDLFNGGLDKRDSKNRVVTHTFRHTFASHLAINGTPIFTIQKLMNHKDIQQTMRYAKLAPDSGRDMVEEPYK